MISLTNHINQKFIKKFLGVDGALPFAITERILYSNFAHIFQEFCQEVFLKKLFYYDPEVTYYLRNFKKAQPNKQIRIYTVTNVAKLDHCKLDQMLLDRYIIKYEDYKQDPYVTVLN